MGLTGQLAETHHSFRAVLSNVSPKSFLQKATPNIGLGYLFKLYRRITSIKAKLSKTLIPEALRLEAKRLKHLGLTFLMLYG